MTDLSLYSPFSVNLLAILSICISLPSSGTHGVALDLAAGDRCGLFQNYTHFDCACNKAVVLLTVFFFK